MSQPTQAAAAAPFITVQLIPPDKFDFNNANEWPKWIRRFERFRVASSLDKQTQEYQVNILMYVLGDEAEDILNVLPLNEDQKKSYEDVKQAFGKHCAGRNIIFERAPQTPSFGTPFGSPFTAAPSPAPVFGAKPNAAPVFGQQANSSPVFGAAANSAPGGGFQFGGASGFGPSDNSSTTFGAGSAASPAPLTNPSIVPLAGAPGGAFNFSQPTTLNIGSTKSFMASPAGQQTIAGRKIKTAVQRRK